MKRGFTSISPRTLWAIGIVGINSVAAGLVIASGELLGDFAGEQPAQISTFVITATAVCLSVFLLLLAFNSATKLDIGLRSVKHDRDRIGVLLAIAQCAFIVYVQQTGLFIAGSAERGGSMASAFWVLLNLDALLIIYYGSCRDSKRFGLNLTLWMVSFLQRGWFAFLFVVVALESFHAIRRRRVSAGQFVLVGLLIATYPLLDLLKIYVRVADVISPAQALSYVGNELTSVDFRWIDSLAESGERIVARIQVVSHAQAIQDNASYFQGLVTNGSITPFWKEGLLGIIWDQQMGNSRAPETAQALAAFIAPGLDSSWNVNPSLLGWLTVHGQLLPLALLYLVTLCAASVVLAQLIDNRAAFHDTVWFIWLIFLVPGWISQFVSFVLAMGVYLALMQISRLRWIDRRTLSRRSNACDSG